MKRAWTTLTAALLLMACENKEPVSPTAGINTTSGGEEDSESGTSTSAGETVDPPQTTTESAATSETDGETETDGDTTCSFIQCGTTGTPPPEVECDNWAQDCPAGQKCSAWANDGGSSWNSLKCVPVEENSGAPGDPCTVEGSGVSGIDSCALGSMCWNVDNDTGQGTCVDLCNGSPEAPDCADQSTTCVIANDGVLNLCLPQCDPLLQDCAGSDLCLPNPADEGFVCVLDASGDAGVAFDPCEFANACDKGLTCQDPGFATECDSSALGCCLPYCDITAPDCPGAGQECITWYEQGTAPPGFENLGLCGIPMG
ncbi:ribulose phosphate epimerase [Nannocystis bainbridge]|uniref:Ribulose phosphate epimerase n=1 Tax=Nannocystis bainbridge TaxID=2995303 RepID=A0ABT5EAK6_9BACT|nr:ribulose phosphate epimerase [Nannocystis bainbridge]MDC0722892.1 ribulose phosphate epimerase [Nannocystis bainbridge]